jgi:hypothetical protein
MNKTVKETKLDAFRYWFEDGLSEISIGMLFLIIGLVLQAENLLPPGSFLSGVAGFGNFILVLAGVWLVRRVVRSLKSRLTYPRTGYVVYRKIYPVQRFLTLIIGVFIVFLMVWMFIEYPQASPVWVPLIQGIVLGIFLVMIGLRSGLARFHILALFTLLLSFGLSQVGNGETPMVGAIFAALGLGLTISGVIGLKRYIEQTQPHQEIMHGE